MSSAAAPATLLLCIGNTLRGDDGVAHRIGEAVEDLRLPALTVLYSQQLLPEHAFVISEAYSVLFLDCSTVSAPGEVVTHKIEPAAALPRIFTHHLGPDALLRMALDLYQRSPSRATLITVGGADFELSESLSPAVASALPAAIAAVRSALSTI